MSIYLFNLRVLLTKRNWKFRWKLVEVDSDLSALTFEVKHVRSLISPANTYMVSALVPIKHYAGELRDAYMGPSSSYKPLKLNIVPQGRYQMDHNTL